VPRLCLIQAAAVDRGVSRRSTVTTLAAKRVTRIPIEKGATLYQRANNRIWWLDLQFEGDRIRKSLKTGDRNKALVIARELVNATLAGRWNIRLASEVTLEKAIELFRTEYEALHHCANTQDYTRELFRRFTGFMAERHPGRTIKLDGVRRDDIVGFQLARAAMTTIHKKQVSAATVNRDVRELQTFFTWAADKGIVRVNPCMGVKSMKGVKRIKKPLSTDEIKKLIAKLPETLADLARLILNTGLRLGEGLHMRGEDIDLGTKLLVIRSRLEYPIKDREEREIPMNEVALAIATRRKLAAGDGGLLFPSATGQLFHRRNALRDLKTACRHAGIREIDWYLMRHTFASIVARHVPPHVLKTLLGHSDVRTADKFYVHLRGGDFLPPPVAAG